VKAANIVINALKPGNAREMAHKLSLRWRERHAQSQRAAVAAWCQAHSTDIQAWASGIDSAAWKEACAFAEDQRRIAEDKLGHLGVDLGGGGAYHLLYFLTRTLRPKVVVETGVAAGFSSRAFLSALRSNGAGRLLSSDFPYFRLRDPERYVGILVEPELRSNWQPLLKGDRSNLPEIVKQIGEIDLVHYDSDKSYEGRAFAMRTLGSRLAADGIILFDDIQDNWHFRDIIQKRRFLIFPFEGKWVGMFGGPDHFYEPNVAE
jgi:hypothetical protein